ncbi:hypothetical protein L596_007053 [Steinernema carpocapsae]|uniref:Uncharacterized protein n=1 Tax=Steinernema carpocapsae TaxID=34508 RepID=A0A4U5P8H8_STECR|nr:hypothetical protein L596_007053 [Steinernema carpocapsae]
MDDSPEFVFSCKKEKFVFPVTKPRKLCLYGILCLKSLSELRMHQRSRERCLQLILPAIFTDDCNRYFITVRLILLITKHAVA